MLRAAACLQVLCAAGVAGKLTEREIDSRWSYLGHFVFDTSDLSLATNKEENKPLIPWVHAHRTDGDVYLPDIKTPAGQRGYSLVVYSDQDFSWNEALKSIDLMREDPTLDTCRRLSGEACAPTCADCMAKTCSVRELLYLRPHCPGATPTTGKEEDFLAGNCSGTEARPLAFPIRQQSRPRIWYVAIVNCDETLSGETPPIKVSVHFQNPGGFFKAEFGVDEQGILEFQILLVPLFTIMTAVYCTTTYHYNKLQGSVMDTHAVVKWFIIVLMLQTLFFLDKLLKYLNTAMYGSGGQPLIVLGTLADVMMMMLCVNFATGFSAIGRQFFSPLKDPHHANVIAGMGIGLIVLDWLLFFWSWFFADPFTIYHYYQTWPAIILACARLPIGVYYVYNLYKRVVELPDQASFYKRWGWLFFLYVISYPFLMGAAHAVSPHVKFKAVDLSVDCIKAVSMIAMMKLLWPGARLSMVLANTYTITEDVDHVPMTDGPNGVDPFDSSRRSMSVASNGSFMRASEAPPPLSTGMEHTGGRRSRHNSVHSVHSEIEMGLLDDAEQSLLDA